MRSQKATFHPTPEGQERAFEGFANLNREAVEKAERRGVATVSATIKSRPLVSCCAPVAQRLEQQTHNLLVRGSNPCGGTKKRIVRWRIAEFQLPLKPFHNKLVRGWNPCGGTS